MLELTLLRRRPVLDAVAAMEASEGRRFLSVLSDMVLVLALPLPGGGDGPVEDPAGLSEGPESILTGPRGVLSRIYFWPLTFRHSLPR